MASLEIGNRSKHSKLPTSPGTMVPLASARKLWPAASLPKMVL